MRDLMSIPDVYKSFKRTAKAYNLNSDSPLACEDYCIYDAGHSCTECERYENTKYYKDITKVLEETIGS